MQKLNLEAVVDLFFIVLRSFNSYRLIEIVCLCLAFDVFLNTSLEHIIVYQGLVLPPNPNVLVNFIISLRLNHLIFLSFFFRLSMVFNFFDDLTRLCCMLLHLAGPVLAFFIRNDFKLWCSRWTSCTLVIRVKVIKITASHAIDLTIENLLFSLVKFFTRGLS